MYSDEFIPDRRVNLIPKNEAFKVSRCDVEFPKERCFQIHLQNSGEVIGEVNYCRYSPKLGEAEIGIEISSSWQGKGYGQESLHCFLEYLFCKMNLSKVVLAVGVENFIAQNLYYKLGFTIDARILDGAYDAKGEQFIDIYLMSLVKEHFRCRG